MTREEFDRWQAVTTSSENRWTEDEVYRLNGRGLLYYTGGEDGMYMKIKRDGTLELGYYDGAIPHIGEALFRPQVTEQLGNYNAAFEKACQPGGKQFLVDMFSQECFAAPQFPDEPEMGC